MGYCLGSVVFKMVFLLPDLIFLRIDLLHRWAYLPKAPQETGKYFHFSLLSNSLPSMEFSDSCRTVTYPAVHKDCSNTQNQDSTKPSMIPLKATSQYKCICIHLLWSLKGPSHYRHAGTDLSDFPLESKSKGPNQITNINSRPYLLVLFGCLPSA